MSLVGNKNLPADMIAEIVERTDGIPLFVEEMTKAVLEAESESVARRTVAAAPSAALAVPASLHASLMARLGPAQPGQGGGADRRGDEGAAKAESQSPGTGVAGASSQLLAGSPRAQQPAAYRVADGGRSDGHRPGRFGQRCSLLATQQQAVVKGGTLKC